MKKLTKHDLAWMISKTRRDWNGLDVKDALTEFGNIVADMIQNGEVGDEISIPRVFKIRIVEKKGWMGRNPKNGDKAEVKSGTRAKFIVSKTLKRNN